MSVEADKLEELMREVLTGQALMRRVLAKLDARNEQAWVNRLEVAEILGISERQTYRWVDTGKLPEPTKFGKTHLWVKETVTAIASRLASKP